MGLPSPSNQMGAQPSLTGLSLTGTHGGPDMQEPGGGGPGAGWPTGAGAWASCCWCSRTSVPAGSAADLCKMAMIHIFAAVTASPTLTARSVSKRRPAHPAGTCPGRGQWALLSGWPATQNQLLSTPAPESPPAKGLPQVSSQHPWEGPSPQGLSQQPVTTGPSPWAQEVLRFTWCRDVCPGRGAPLRVSELLQA